MADANLTAQPAQEFVPMLAYDHACVCGTDYFGALDALCPTCGGGTGAIHGKAKQVLVPANTIPAGYVSDLVDGARFTVEDPDDVAIAVFTRPQVEAAVAERIRPLEPLSARERQNLDLAIRVARSALGNVATDVSRNQGLREACAKLMDYLRRMSGTV